MFLMDTAIFIIDIRNTVKGISLTLTSNWDMSLEDRYALTGSLPWQANAALYAFMVCPFCAPVCPQLLTGFD